jgi:phosphatidylglycerol:prolipoprotein diacylglycerol transferase
VLDLAFWVTIAGLLGSRLAYGLVNAPQFARLCAGTDGGGRARGPGAWLADCARIFFVWEGGLVFYGGVLAALVVAAVFARRERWSFWQVGDIFAPALAIGHALGRLGCFAAGCCFGKASTAPWAVAFPRGSVAFDELLSTGTLALAHGAAFTPALHPTQLYEAAGEMGLFALLVALRPRLRRQPGALILTYAALYAALRFVVELYRGDFARVYLVGLATPRLSAFLALPAGEPALLSVGQLTSVLVFLAAVAAFFMRRRAWSRAQQRPAP